MNTSVDIGLRFANRVAQARQTALRRLSARCAELGGVNLSQGLCDLPTPDPVRLAAKQAIDDDHSTYTNIAGTIELRRAIAEKLKTFNRFEVDAATQVAVTVGAAGGFACVALATLNPGDEVIVFSPFYTYYTDLLKLLDVNVRFVHTKPPDWRYASDELAAAFNDGTRMVLVNTPANPSGKVFSRDELTEIVDLCTRHGVWLVTDEAYEYITYDARHISAASLPGAADLTITMGSASKTYAITGWRIGYVAASPSVIEKLLVVNDLLNICAPSPLQHGVLGGLKMEADYYEQMRSDYRAKRDMLADTLRSIGFEPYVPQGAFYMMADFGAGRYPNALSAAEQILESVGVATVPGAPFYADPSEGETQLRLCYAKRFEDLEEGCRRLKLLAR